MTLKNKTTQVLPFHFLLFFPSPLVFIFSSLCHCLPLFLPSLMTFLELQEMTSIKVKKSNQIPFGFHFCFSQEREKERVQGVQRYVRALALRLRRAQYPQVSSRNQNLQSSSCFDYSENSSLPLPMNNRVKAKPHKSQCSCCFYFSRLLFLVAYLAIFLVKVLVVILVCLAQCFNIFNDMFGSYYLKIMKRAMLHQTKSYIYI